MASDLFQSSGWYRAASLAERAAGNAADENYVVPDGPAAERAARKFQRWAAQPPFSSTALFAQRLAPVKLDEPLLLQLLGESPDAVRLRFAAVPGWLDEIIQAFSGSLVDAATAAPEGYQADEPRMLGVVAPLIRRGTARLGRELDRLVAAHPGAPIDRGAIVAIFMPRLRAQLFQLVGRTIALELNVARLQGTLQGETPAGRFLDFLQTVAQPDAALTMLEEYAVLARLGVEWIDRWVDATLEFIERLCEDWDAIRARFGSELPAGGPGVLTEVNQGAGDTHRGGRAVTVATFSSGFKLVYKPRPLAVETHFQELLGWVNEREPYPAFPQLRVLERTSYGWVQFIAQAACRDEEQLDRFFQRQGGYLALLYALEATDFHFENVIAAGETPVLIDLESLFHARPGGLAGSDQTADARDDPKALFHVGLLPLPREAMAEFAGLDVSGLGAPAGQVTAKAVSQWDGIETDQMRIVRKPAALDGAQNRPSLDGRDVNAAEHAGAIVAGFTSVYRTLVRDRAEVLSDAGPCKWFARDEVRVILRATQTYAMLLSDSLHPDVLRDALDRDRLLDRFWVAVPNWPRLADVVRREHEDLLRGDIPMFTTRPDSRDLLPASGGPIQGFLDEPSIDRVRRRILRLSEEDMALQVRVIETAFAEPLAAAVADLEVGAV